MDTLNHIRRRVRALASAAAFSLLPGSALVAAPVSVDRASGPPTIVVTAADVAASNTKVKMAYDDLIAMWTTQFTKLGERFAVPDIARYRSPIRTACGVMDRNNAGYCPTDNTIYYDDVFVAAQAKMAAREVGTDGDMAAIGIIAHEMGHAVAMQLGHDSRISYQNESVADCLAGAFAQRAEHAGTLEKGDVEEAFAAMARAGDPTPELTGDQRTDQRILARMAVRGHGTREQRMQNFRSGLSAGAGACLPEFR